MQRPPLPLIVGALVALAAAVLLGAAWQPPRPPMVVSTVRTQGGPLPERGVVADEGELELDVRGHGLLYTWGPVAENWSEAPPEGVLRPAQLASAEQALMTPTSLHWRRPIAPLPEATVLWVADRLADGRISAPTKHTYTTVDHGALPVLSLTAHPGAWSDPDTGLLVVGHGIFDADEAVLDYYANDPRWWKYPGNFHGRGRAWERSAHVELFTPDGGSLLHAPVGVRMNGQMTRGFPQHAFRLLFEKPLERGIFADGDGADSKALILRAAGNDQVKAMLRDAYQHGLCHGLPFGTSRALSCVVYVNGAYWGVHHLRQRMDEKELARRHGVKKGKVDLLEDRARIVHGDSAAVKDFLRLVYRARNGNAQQPEWLADIERQLDVDAFLTYMASQMVLGNMDWPRQNVKYWRYTGKAVPGTELDGRWHFIMGDSDLSFGANAPVDVGLFAQVKLANAPVPALFMGLYRSAEVRRRFLEHVTALLDGPLSAARCTAQLDSLAALLAPEMDRHTRRWRKPSNVAAWQAEVELMRHYAAGREAACREQIKALKEGATPR
ncbi:MAG: CotH kinase family protein [Flavobacteriales bacterium]